LPVSFPVQIIYRIVSYRVLNRSSLTWHATVNVKVTRRLQIMQE